MKLDSNGLPRDRDAQRVRWIREYRASGMGLRQFAQRNGLKPGRLHYWVYQKSKPLKRQASVPMFQEVRLPANALSSGSWTAEIGLPNGTSVRLARETDPIWATRLLDSLRRPCS